MPSRPIAALLAAAIAVVAALTQGIALGGPPAPACAPTLSVFTAASGSVRLEWSDAPPHAEGWEYREHLGYLGLDTGWDEWRSIPGADASITDFTVAGLVQDRRYQFQLRGVNANGSGPASEPASAVAGLTPNLSSYLVPLSHENMDTDGGATAAGSFVFLTDADDLTSGATSFVEIAFAEALLLNAQGSDGASHASLFDRVEPYDYFNWFPYRDCFYSYYVTEVLPDPPAPARKLFGIRIYHQDGKCEHSPLSSMQLLKGGSNNPALLEWRRLHGQVVGPDGIRLLQGWESVGGHTYRLTDHTGPTSILIDVPVGVKLRPVISLQALDGSHWYTYADMASDVLLTLNPQTGEGAHYYVEDGWVERQPQEPADLVMRFDSLIASIREVPLP